MGKDVAGLRFGLIPVGLKEDFRQLFYSYLKEIAVYYGDWLAREDYVYPYFDAYWEEPETRWLYAVFAAKGEIAGFAMVRLMENGVIEIAEFGVHEAYRQQGVGKLLLDGVLMHHTGDISLDYVLSNQPAEKFWMKQLGEMPGWYHRPIMKEGLASMEFRLLTEQKEQGK